MEGVELEWRNAAKEEKQGGDDLTTSRDLSGKGQEKVPVYKQDMLAIRPVYPTCVAQIFQLTCIVNPRMLPLIVVTFFFYRKGSRTQGKRSCNFVESTSCRVWTCFLSSSKAIFHFAIIFVMYLWLVEDVVEKYRLKVKSNAWEVPVSRPIIDHIKMKDNRILCALNWNYVSSI